MINNIFLGFEGVFWGYIAKRACDHIGHTPILSGI